MTSDSSRLTRRPRPVSPRRVRSAAAIIATAGFTLLAAACGSSPSSTGSGGSANAGGKGGTQPASVSPALAFTRCVRTHGIPGYPDPDSNGAIAKETPQQLGVSDSQYQAAQSACQHLLPNGGQQSNTATVADQRNAVRFAGCMRSHGVPNWPDPVNDGGRIRFDVFGGSVRGLDPSSPQVMAAVQRCQSLLHIDLERIGMG
jgi:hypothetical protein